MRRRLLCTMLTLAAMPAAASSIVAERDLTNSADSVSVITCSTCSSPQDLQVSSYKTPELASGVVEAKIGEWHGKDDLIRVDRFMGGSPVMTVSSAQAKLHNELTAANERLKEERIANAGALVNEMSLKAAGGMNLKGQIPLQPPSVDTTISTAALDNGPETAKFDPSKLQLRVNFIVK